MNVLLIGLALFAGFCIPDALYVFVKAFDLGIVYFFKNILRVLAGILSFLLFFFLVQA